MLNGGRRWAANSGGMRRRCQREASSADAQRPYPEASNGDKLTNPNRSTCPPPTSPTAFRITASSKSPRPGPRSARTRWPRNAPPPLPSSRPSARLDPSCGPLSRLARDNATLVLLSTREGERHVVGYRCHLSDLLPSVHQAITRRLLGGSNTTATRRLPHGGP